MFLKTFNTHASHNSHIHVRFTRHTTYLLCIHLWMKTLLFWHFFPRVRRFTLTFEMCKQQRSVGWTQKDVALKHVQTITIISFSLPTTNKQKTSHTFSQTSHFASLLTIILAQLSVTATPISRDWKSRSLLAVFWWWCVC